MLLDCTSHSSQSISLCNKRQKTEENGHGRGNSKFDINCLWLKLSIYFSFQLWTQRITAGAESHGLTVEQFSDGLYKNNILINRKVLSELAVWEPRTFEALAKISADAEDKDPNINWLYNSSCSHFIRPDNK